MSDCSICGSDQSELLFETHDRLFNFADTYNYWRCLTCGLVYLAPQPNWAARAEHYRTTYRGYHYVESEASRLQRWGMRYGLAKRLRILQPFVCFTEKRTLLDVGCGSGNFIDWAATYTNWHALGLERVDSLMGQTTTSNRRLQGDLHALPLDTDTIDIVTLWTVLEHLSDPLTGLREAARVLRRGGLIVVRTVWTKSRVARLFHHNWVGVDAPRVLYAFSQKALTQLLDLAGFRIERIGSFFHDFHPSLWSLRNWCDEKISQRSVHTLINRTASSWAARLLTFPFFALQTAQNRNSFVTVIARRR